MFLAYKISRLELSCFFVFLLKYFQCLCMTLVDGPSFLDFSASTFIRPIERRHGVSKLKTKPALRLDLEPKHKQQVAPR